ncbi:MAG: hypothetical protein ACJA16_003089 [Akkermansiaceae bacterium]|jgi:hypothetical protein
MIRIGCKTRLSRVTDEEVPQQGLCRVGKCTFFLILDGVAEMRGFRVSAKCMTRDHGDVKRHSLRVRFEKRACRNKEKGTLFSIQYGEFFESCRDGIFLRENLMKFLFLLLLVFPLAAQDPVTKGAWLRGRRKFR